MQRCLSKCLPALALLAALCTPAAAQSRSDIQLIRSQDFHESLYDKRKVKFMLSSRKNPVIRYNPVSLFFGGMMYTYQKVLSPQISAKCPYEISCSNFSKQCISEYGLIKGIALSADRITRCTRLASADLTPLDVKDGQKVMDDPKRYRRNHKK